MRFSESPPQRKLYDPVSPASRVASEGEEGARESDPDHLRRGDARRASPPNKARPKGRGKTKGKSSKSKPKGKGKDEPGKGKGPRKGSPQYWFAIRQAKKNRA